jgi:hypothetical protein
MKIVINIFLITFILLLSGCSTKKLTVKTLYPSQIENEKIHTIKVQPFYRDDINLTTNLENKISNKYIDNKKIFTLTQNNLSTDAILSGEISNSSLDFHPYYRTETDFSRCKYYRYDDKNRTKECIEYRTRMIPCEKREYNVTANIKLIKPTENTILFSKTYDKSNFDDICFDRHPYNISYNDSKDKYRVNSLLADDIASDILDDISPHYIYYDLEIIDELDSNTLAFTKEQENKFEKIVEFIESKNLDLAKTALEKLDEEFKEKSFEVKYNLALVYEAYNQLSTANELYHKARALTLDIKKLELVNFAIGRTHKNLEARNKAKIQLPQ